MKHAQAARSNRRLPGVGRTPTRGALALATVCALALGACGGGDDDDESASSTTAAASQTTVTSTTAAAPTTTAATTTSTTLPELDLVTEGATVVVANASGINGSAGRMSDALGIEGFTMGDATNSSEGPLETSKVYYNPDNPDAKPVADSVRLALGGGDIEVVELAVPAPTESGEIGDATVLLAMGNDTADVPLSELQGGGPVTEATDEATAEATDEATAEATGESTGDATDEATSDG